MTTYSGACTALLAPDATGEGSAPGGTAAGDDLPGTPAAINVERSAA